MANMENLSDGENVFRYDAFISYRHAGMDEAAAAELHRRIETYRVPRAVRKSSGKQKMGRVFRDQEELPTSADLGAEIEKALEESAWLIVVCSPRLIESSWCMREIDAFIALGRRDHILTLMIDGEEKSSLPGQLCIETAGDGHVAVRSPLYADVRAPSWPLMKKNIRRECLRMLAPMLGVSFDDLKRRQRERFLRTVAAAACLVAALASGFLAFALHQNTMIENERNAALTSQSLFLADLSGQQLEKGERVLAILLAREALPKDFENPERPLVPAAEAALKTADLQASGAAYTPAFVIPAEGVTLSVQRQDAAAILYPEYAGDEIRTIALGRDNRYSVWDRVSGALKSEMRFDTDPAAGVGNAAFIDSEGNIAANHPDGLEWIVLDTVVAAAQEPIEFLRPNRTEWDESLYQVAQNMSAIYHTWLIWDYKYAEIQYAAVGKEPSPAALELPVFGETPPLIESVAVSESANCVALGFQEAQGRYPGDAAGALYNGRTGAFVANLTVPAQTGEDRARESGTTFLAFSPNEALLVTVSCFGDLRLWDTKTGALIAAADLKMQQSNTMSASPYKTAAFHEKGTKFAAITQEGGAAIFDAKGNEVAAVKTGGRTLTGLEWGSGAASETLLCTVSDSNEAILFDARSGEEIFALASDEPVFNAAFADSGDDSDIILWRASSFQIWRKQTENDDIINLPIASVPFYMGWSEGGDYAAVGDPNGGVTVFDAADGAPIDMDGAGTDALFGNKLLEYKKTILAYSGGYLLKNSEGTLLAQKNGDRKSIDVTDAETAALATTIVVEDDGRMGDAIRDWSWRPGDEAILTEAWGHSSLGVRIFEEDTVTLWDARTGKERYAATGQLPAFSRDGSKLATAGTGKLMLYDAGSGAPVAERRIETMTSAYARTLFDPAGRIVACGNVLWFPDTDAVILLDTGQDEAVVSFSPDGQYCVAGSRVFSTETGDAVVTLPGANTLYGPICFSPDGSRVLVSSGRHSASIIPFPSTAEALALADSLAAGRTLTETERKRFFLESAGESEGGNG
jgi:WD40 repeat protein